MALTILRKIFDFLAGGPPAFSIPQPNASDQRNHGDRHGDKQLEPHLVDHQVEQDNPTAQSTPMKTPLMANTPVQAISVGPEAIDYSDKPEMFRRILLLLRLVTTVKYGIPAWKLARNDALLSSRFHTKSYGYLDALTTLLLRRDEIVAAAESSPGSGFIMSQSGNDSTKPEVCWDVYFVTSHSLTLFMSKPEDSEPVDPEFYDTRRSLPSSVRVTGIANPERSLPHGTNINQVKVLHSKSKSLWEDLKKDEYYYLRMTPERRWASIFWAVCIHLTPAQSGCSLGETQT